MFRWKAIEMCQGLRFDHADASFGAGEECRDTIGRVQHLWLTELTQTHEHSQEAGFFKWATGMDPPENGNPHSSCPFHDVDTAQEVPDPRDPWPNQYFPPEDEAATQALLPEGTPPFHVWKKCGEGEEEELYRLPQGRVFSYVTARVPEPGETPKLEVVSGDLNSLASGKPVIRRVWELS